MSLLAETDLGRNPHIGFPVWIILRIALTILVFIALCSCTLLGHSPYLAQKTVIPVLTPGQGLAVTASGRIPYQRWRVSSWDDELRYVWLVGDYDFRKHRSVEIILYFHGMHSKDYYRDFRRELESLAIKRPDRPFLFVGFVDTPYTLSEHRGKNRWSSLVPEPGHTPDRLIDTVNSLFKAFRKRFPQVRKEQTHLVLAGFSGGGKVLDAVGTWLARAKDDPYADVFRSRLRKIAYFDCWFGKDVVDTVPTLLQDNPRMKIVGTVHMETPRKNALLLANKLNMKPDVTKRELVGLDGRLLIYRNDSHWAAMITRLKEALSSADRL
jgi:hypothetical protein